MGGFSDFAPCGDDAPPRPIPTLTNPTKKVNHNENAEKYWFQDLPSRSQNRAQRWCRSCPRWSNCFVSSASVLIEASELVSRGFGLFSHGFWPFLAILAWFFTVFKALKSDSDLFQLVNKRFRSVSIPRIAFQHSESHFHTHKTPTQHSKTRPQHSETPKISNFAHQIVSILE